MRRLKRASTKKGEAVSLPQGNTTTLSTVAAVLEPAVMRPADPEGAAKPVLKKPGGATLLAKKRTDVANDE